jgi:hypothetical protein
MGVAPTKPLICRSAPLHLPNKIRCSIQREATVPASGPEVIAGMQGKVDACAAAAAFGGSTPAA